MAADVHGILLRVASLEDTLRGKMKVVGALATKAKQADQGLADIARLVEAHPQLWELLTNELKREVHPPVKE